MSRLGELLVREKMISLQQLQRAQEEAKRTGKRLGHALTQLGFDALRARRIELRMDDGNQRSRRVAERAGFTLEGVLRRQSLTPQGEPRDTRVYAKLREASVVG